jgi:hypothetical protein
MESSCYYELKVKFNRHLKSPLLKESYFDVPKKYISLCIDGVRIDEFINQGISTFLISSLNSCLTLEVFERDIKSHLDGKIKDFKIISLDRSNLRG